MRWAGEPLRNEARQIFLTLVEYMTGEKMLKSVQVKGCVSHLRRGRETADERDPHLLVTRTELPPAATLSLVSGVSAQLDQLTGQSAHPSPRTHPGPGSPNHTAQCELTPPRPRARPTLTRLGRFGSKSKQSAASDFIDRDRDRDRGDNDRDYDGGSSRLAHMPTRSAPPLATSSTSVC